MHTLSVYKYIYVYAPCIAHQKTKYPAPRFNLPITVSLSVLSSVFTVGRSFLLSLFVVGLWVFCKMTLQDNRGRTM